MKNFWMFILIAVWATVQARADGVDGLPKCGEDLQAMACQCNGEVRTGDKVAQTCDQLPNAPSAVKVSHFGLHSVGVQSGYMSGVGGTGYAGVVSAEVFSAKLGKKLGNLSAEVEAGRFNMDGITKQVTEDLGPAVPGYPAAGELNANATVKVSNSAYYPVSAVKYSPVSLFHDRVQPFVGFEAGVVAAPTKTEPFSPTVVDVLPNGQTIPVETLPAQTERTGYKTQFAGALVGGANVKLTNHVDAVVEYRSAPTAEYSIWSGGVQYNFKKNDSNKKKVKKVE
jgi:hypothetical protein